MYNFMCYKSKVNFYTVLQSFFARPRGCFSVHGTILYPIGIAKQNHDLLSIKLHEILTHVNSSGLLITLTVFDLIDFTFNLRNI